MEKEQLDMMRHSCAHLVAAAVQAMYPEAKFGVGPVVENGFYYDIEFPETISEESLQDIEKKAKHMVKQNLQFERMEMKIDEAIKFFTEKNQTYKVLLLKDLKEKGTTKMSAEELQDFGNSVGTVSLYKTGEFVDLCRGPHISSTKEMGAFKLTKLAGAYWRGDEKNPQLQRIYGVCFATQEELDNYLSMLAEAEKRDHRKIGKEQELFMMHDFAPGMPFFLPHGQIIFNELIKFIKEISYGEGYSEVKTPQIFNAELWKTSGHWDHYQDVMFHFHHEDDDVDFGVKPMNCPGHMLVFKNGMRSYRDLPLRLAETTTLYRNEKSGTLHGLTRVRSLSQDDCHIFLREDQISAEISSLLNKIKTIYQMFSLQIDEIHLSTRPESFLGEIEVWNKAEADLANALKEASLEYKINAGDGAFYGPKIDVKVKDAIGRQWQLATIQLDFQLPGRFDLTYVDSDGKEKTPVVIHRALLGTVERFMGVMIEHYAGAFPTWLSPVQIQFVPVSEKHVEGALKLQQECKEWNIRTEVDDADETVGKKVKKAVSQKIPYIVVIGDNELGLDPSTNSGLDWTIRVRGQEEQLKISKKDFLEKVKKEIEERM